MSSRRLMSLATFALAGAERALLRVSRTHLAQFGEIVSDTDQLRVGTVGPLGRTAIVTEVLVDFEVKVDDSSCRSA